MRAALVCLTLLFASFLPSFAFGEDELFDEAQQGAAGEFTLKDSRGRIVTLSSLRGKAVVLNFWAAWCPPCVEEMPSLEALHKKLASKGLVIVAIGSDSAEAVKGFADSSGYSFIMAADEDGRVARMYNARLLPATFIIDRNGRITGKALGARQWDGPGPVKYLEELLSK